MDNLKHHHIHLKVYGELSIKSDMALILTYKIFVMALIILINAWGFALRSGLRSAALNCGWMQIFLQLTHTFSEL